MPTLMRDWTTDDLGTTHKGFMCHSLQHADFLALNRRDMLSQTPGHFVLGQRTGQPPFFRRGLSFDLSRLRAERTEKRERPKCTRTPNPVSPASPRMSSTP